MKILLITEQREAKWNKVSFETLAAAQQIAQQTKGTVSAVVIGSMVPDFGYLMPIRLARFETHSLLALATFCLPVGTASYWIFQRLMKTPLVSVLPDQVYMRWRSYSAPAAWDAGCGRLAPRGSISTWVMGRRVLRGRW